MMPLIPINPLLAQSLQLSLKRYALDGAAFLQQLHYWATKKCGVIENGKRWIYNSYQAWRSQLNWLSDYNFRQLKNRLINAGLLETKQLGTRDKGRDRTLYYAINYDHPLFNEVNPFSTDARVEKLADAKVERVTFPSVSCVTDTIDPGITPEITNKTTTNTPDVVVANRCAQEEEINVEQIDSCCTEIRAVSRDVQVNLSVRKAIALHWIRFPAALERLKKAKRENWRCNHTGVLVKALKDGVPEESALPITIGFADWFNEGRKRDILWASYSEGSDIKVLFKSGAARLWSEIKGLSWEDLRKI